MQQEIRFKIPIGTSWTLKNKFHHNYCFSNILYCFSLRINGWGGFPCHCHSEGMSSFFAIVFMEYSQALQIHGYLTDKRRDKSGCRTPQHCHPCGEQIRPTSFLQPQYLELQWDQLHTRVLFEFSMCWAQKNYSHELVNSQHSNSQHSRMLSRCEALVLIIAFINTTALQVEYYCHYHLHVTDKVKVIHTLIGRIRIRTYMTPDIKTL